mmetsp:Transcript_30806/g.57539  ORF Transcript_30806/g.57539 Transcript_30806/m.57539 type:complete len:218 (+) Transcript_30806:1620-2273(+)
MLLAEALRHRHELAKTDGSCSPHHRVLALRGVEEAALDEAPQLTESLLGVQEPRLCQLCKEIRLSLLLPCHAHGLGSVGLLFLLLFLALLLLLLLLHLSLLALLSHFLVLLSDSLPLECSLQTLHKDDHAEREVSGQVHDASHMNWLHLSVHNRLIEAQDRIPHILLADILLHDHAVLSSAVSSVISITSISIFDWRCTFLRGWWSCLAMTCWPYQD